MINVAKWALLTILGLPFLELAVFIVVTAIVGFGWALSLALIGSAAGFLILRYATGGHIARIRVALNQGRFTSLQPDGSGGLIIAAGILLPIPGFITDIVALCLLVPPFRHVIVWRSAVRLCRRVMMLWPTLHPDNGTKYPSPPCQTVESSEVSCHIGMLSKKIMRTQNDTVLVPFLTLC